MPLAGAPPGSMMSPCVVAGLAPVLGGVAPVIGGIPCMAAAGAPMPPLAVASAPVAPVGQAVITPQPITAQAGLLPNTLAANALIDSMAGVGVESLGSADIAAVAAAAAAAAHDTVTDAEAAETIAQNPELIRVVLQQAYLQATQMAKAKGYHSLEHMEVHRQVMVTTKSKKGKSRNTTMFVGGLKKTVDEDVVKAHFEKYGTVARVDVIRNMDGTSRGFAFVKMAEEQDVDKCLAAKFEHVLEGKWVNVRPKDDEAADTGKQATQAIELAAQQVGVDPSEYLNYLTRLASVKYGYARRRPEDDSAVPARGKPY